MRLRALLFLALAAPAAAGPVRAVRSEAELVSSVRAFRPGETFWAAVRLKPDPGWHVYWENPGDSGAPPVVTWRMPEGFSAEPPRFPRPERLPVGPLVNYGYRQEVLLPARFTPAPGWRRGRTAVLRARAEWLVCKEECLPAAADLTLRLPPAAASRPHPRWGPRLEETLKTLPRSLPGWGLSAEAVAGALRLTLRPPPGESVPETAYFFPLKAPILDHAAPQPVEARQGSLVLTLPLAPEAAAAPARLEGILAAPAGFAGVPALSVDVPVGAAARTGGFLRAILLALAGGLLLNLMPCVFPVLSIKILAVVGHAGSSRRRSARHALAYSAGVLACFWALAGGLLALRAGGRALGWGFQLQSPLFVGLLALVFLVLGLSLLGALEIGLFFTRFSSAGAFSSGALAAVAATPCTAPFMGAAVGYALTLSAPSALAVFTALAVGMAAPYVLLSLRPDWLSRLPRPGAWMETFKQAMAFPLFGAALWLWWVFARQTGPDGAARLAAGFWAAGLAAWVWGRFGRPAAGPRVRAGAAAVAALLTALAVGAAREGARFKAAQEAPRRAEGGLPWEEYSDRRLSELRAQGRPVFVNFTAAWCVTCQVNERLALRSAAVAEAFKEKGVAALKADWTARDAAIARALAAHGRSGVPLYVLHGPRTGPEILPAVLTPGLVLSALEKLE